TSMLQNLESIFNAVMNAGEELASIGEQLINTLSKYEIELFRLGQALLEMQRELEALHRSRSAVQSIIETMDADVAMTTNHMETQLAANARRSTNMILLLSLLAAAMLAGLAIYGFKIARPIQELTVSASEIAAGDLDHPITTSGSDETGVLGRSFAQMRDAIKDKINALAVKNEELRASEVRYRALVEDTPVLICRFRPNGEIIYANDAYCRQVGETIQGANSGAFLEQVHEEDREKARKALATLSAETPIHSLEFRMIGKEGEPRWHRWIHHALFNAQGEMLACQSIGEDIEERKQAEAERAQLEAQLIQSHKLQAVGQLAGGIAHDFNNMLHVILGHSSLALDKLEAGGEIQLELNAITKAAQSAASLVTQLLAFSRRQVLTLTDLNLNDVIINTLKMIQRVIGENIVLDVIPGHHLGAIYADKVQIEQILMNLCVNARDAMPGGGTITLKTENVLLNDEFCKVHNMDAPGSYVQLSVTDTGCGMDVETLSHIFEPFFTTKEIGAGTGFGLATVYGIIKQHQGIILAESEMGEGTTFRIYLPFSSGQASKPRNVEKKAAPGGAETILLAEDEDAVRRLCQLLLEKAGYIVLPAVDGEEAIQVFEEHEDEIDLALLDVMMPKLGGKAVYDRIKEKRPDVQVIFSSGYSADSIHTDFILNQDMQLIQKPYNRETLLNIIRKTLDAEA
ncbi:PAS domain S-box protein, partial [Candidatus Sumerlaeota bacterium]|nr:PAS domain S-box protein [Candidatus Sumerlaeota bacterium]